MIIPDEILRTAAQNGTVYLIGAGPGGLGRGHVVAVHDLGVAEWGGYAVCELLVDGMRTRDHLPPGTYTLNYREGLELNTEEAWDYLAGGEERRGNPCDDTDTQVKVVGESAFIRVAGVWDFTHNRKLNAKK